MLRDTLDRDSIGALIRQATPLLENFVSLEQQLQPNGFDITLRDVAGLKSGGFLGAEPDDRELSATESMEFNPCGWLRLDAGPYLITFNETVNLPMDLMALGRPRSSLLRSGVSIHTAVWDAGYRGRSQALLMVYNSAGFRVQQNAPLLPLVFYRVSQQARQGYQGRFQGENI